MDLISSLCVDISSLSCPPCFSLTPFKNPLQCKNPLLHYQHTLICRSSHTRTHKDTQAQMDTSLIPRMNETGNFVSHIKVSIYLKWICLYRMVSVLPSIPHFLSLFVPVINTGGKSCAGEFCVCMCVCVRIVGYSEMPELREIVISVNLMELKGPTNTHTHRLFPNHFNPFREHAL